MKIVISAVIAGIFNLISDHMKSPWTNPAGNNYPARVIHSSQHPVNNELSTGSPYTGSPNFATVLKHVGILQLCRGCKPVKLLDKSKTLM